MTAWVESDRSGQGGKVCAFCHWKMKRSMNAGCPTKTAFHMKVMNSDQRLTVPMIKQNGQMD